jgi:hypothetical protein
MTMKKLTLRTLAAAAIVMMAAPALAQDDIGASIDEFAIKDVNSFTTAPAQILGAGATWSDTNVGGIAWDRPFADCTGVSGLGPVLASTQEFSVAANGAYNFSSVQDGWDGYIFIYEAPFDPTNQSANCVAGDDDGVGGIGTSDIEGVVLNAGVQYIAVTTGFGAGDEGTFTNTISGAGAVFLGPALPEARTVPTLSPIGLGALLLVLGLVASVVLVRRGG